MNRFLSLVDQINEQTGKVVSYLVIILAAVILYEIVARYFFGNPTIWAHETSQIIYGAYVVLLGGYVLKQGAHVNVEILYNRFKPRSRALIDLITWSLFFCFAGVLFWKGLVIGWESLAIRETSPTTFAPPVYPTKLFLPLAALLLLLQGLARYLKTILFLLSGKEEP